MSKSHRPAWVAWTLLDASMPANLLTTDARVFFKYASGLHSGGWKEVEYILEQISRVGSVWGSVFWFGGSAHFIPEIHAPFTSEAPTSILWDIINSAELFNDMEATRTHFMVASIEKFRPSYIVYK
ncbi:hypothetical protein CDAR_542271 [Caerostris darwini]|uniref:Uncharacterized protein n=1 Tax=Caerostris darwini TaxID=1538125 RepID=A0AAV4PG70_9ARAC|nr:hypothetical protein CDAR_542271 [Caerostris darwini]